MFEYLSFRSRPEHLTEKLNAHATEGWELDTLIKDLEKQGIWQVVMRRTVTKKDIIQEED